MTFPLKNTKFPPKSLPTNGQNGAQLKRQHDALGDERLLPRATPRVRGRQQGQPDAHAAAAAVQKEGPGQVRFGAVRLLSQPGLLDEWGDQHRLVQLQPSLVTILIWTQPKPDFKGFHIINSFDSKTSIFYKKASGTMQPAPTGSVATDFGYNIYMEISKTGF